MKVRNRMMAILMFALVLAGSRDVFGTLTIGLGAVPVVTTFDTDLEGWTSNTPAEISWAAGGVGPGGYLRFVDTSGQGTYVYAPPKFLGDWSGHEGEDISYYHKVFETGTVIEYHPYNMRMFGDMLGDKYMWASWSGKIITGVTDWVHVSSQLLELENEWTVEHGEWEDILKNVTNFAIEIEAATTSSTVGDVCGIDNISLVPEPATLLLLGLGGLAVLRKRRA